MRGPATNAVSQPAPLILHVTRRDEWEGALSRGAYEADTLATEGFIHCSEPGQVVETANAFYRGREGLVLLGIDPARLTSPLRYEPSKRGVFPHIYGPLNVSAVVRVVDFPPGSDGGFALPPNFGSAAAGGRELDELFRDFKSERRQAHDRLLALITDLADDQLRARPGPHAPAIGFHLFHTARWADYDRQIIGGGNQIWDRDNVPATWGLDLTELGETATGMGMGDEASERLALPEKELLVAYARQAFVAFDTFLESLPQNALDEPTHPPDGQQRPVRSVLLTHLAHDNRHLGMIEALRGVLGLKGSATI